MHWQVPAGWAGVLGLGCGSRNSPAPPPHLGVPKATPRSQGWEQPLRRGISIAPVENQPGEVPKMGPEGAAPGPWPSWGGWG